MKNGTLVVISKSKSEKPSSDLFDLDPNSFAVTNKTISSNSFELGKFTDDEEYFIMAGKTALFYFFKFHMML
jgi:hypothetical protein